MNQIDKMIGNIMGTPRKRGGRRDWDGDGICNRKDCQPRNTMRQDKISKSEISEVQNFDSKVQEGGHTQLERKLANIYRFSKGKDWGWEGIAKKDPTQFKQALLLARGSTF